jgi:hypothetical protein
LSLSGRYLGGRWAWALGSASVVIVNIIIIVVVVVIATFLVVLSLDGSLTGAPTQCGELITITLFFLFGRDDKRTLITIRDIFVVVVVLDIRPTVPVLASRRTMRAS